MSTTSVPLYRLAHSRTGDKGDISNISVIAWRDDLYAILAAQITPDSVAAWFAYRKPTQVACHAVPSLHALNLVLHGVLDGGVNDALNLDTHGKGLSFHLLNMPIQVPTHLVRTLPDIGKAADTSDSHPTIPGNPSPSLPLT